MGLIMTKLEETISHSIAMSVIFANLLVAIAELAGQSGLNMSMGAVFWILVIEYIMGIVIIRHVCQRFIRPLQRAIVKNSY